jgi:uncharacterized RDD family membrane protein YckC
MEQINWNNWIYRLIAYVIDSIIIGIVSWVILFAVTLAIVFTDFFFFGFAYYGIFLAIIGVLYLLYYTILDSAWGGTIGKRILGLSVQTVNGTRLSIDKSFIRNISKIFWLFLFLDWLIGIVSTGNKQQKFLDRAAGAVVIQKGQAFASITNPPPPPPP